MWSRAIRFCRRLYTQRAGLDHVLKHRRFAKKKEIESISGTVDARPKKATAVSRARLLMTIKDAFLVGNGNTNSVCQGGGGGG